MLPCVQHRALKLLLVLSGLLCLCATASSERDTTVVPTSDITACPPGLVPYVSSSDPNTTSCKCIDGFHGNVECDNERTVRVRNGYWVGYAPDQNGTFAIALCPPGYCYTDPDDEFLTLPNSSDALDEFICHGKNREGILCGRCIENHGPAVNSKVYECVLCNTTHVIANSFSYFFATYVPIFLLFLGIIVFNIRLTTGPANAFILYSQVVSSTFDLDADQHLPLNLISSHASQLLSGYKVVYNIFNLEFIGDFLPPLCLGTRLNALDVLQLNYLVALFPLVMILGIVVYLQIKDRCYGFCIRHRCVKPSQKRKSKRKWKINIADSLVHAFAAFMLLSYTRFSLTSAYILCPQPLLDKDGNLLKPQRIYFAGQYTTADTYYIFRYSVPGYFIFATFVAFPPLLLLGYPVKWLEMCVSRVKWLKKVYPAGKVNILLDTFQGCYKDKMRFFAAMYFLFRLAINAFYIITATWLEQYIAQQILCVLYIGLLALLQPYKNKFYNYVDILILVNLTILNTLSLYLYEFAQNNPGVRLPFGIFMVQYVLVFLPLIYMVGYVIWWAARKERFKQGLANCCLALSKCFQDKQGYLILPNVASNIEESTDITSSQEIEELFERAEERNTYKPGERLIVAKLEDDDKNKAPDDGHSSYGSTESYQLTIKACH